MSKYLPFNLFMRQALIYPLVSPFLPPANKVKNGYSYAAGNLIGTLEAYQMGPQAKDFCVIAPDLVATQHNDDLFIFRADVNMYPYGVDINSVQILSRLNTTYTLIFEEWQITGNAPPTYLRRIRQITLSGTGNKKVWQGGLDNYIIAAGNCIYIDLPTTNIPWIAGKIIFTPRES